MNRTVAEVTLAEFRRIGEEAAKKAVSDLRSAGLLNREPTRPNMDRPPETVSTVKRHRTKHRPVKVVEDPLLGPSVVTKRLRSNRKTSIKKNPFVATALSNEASKEEA